MLPTPTRTPAAYGDIPNVSSWGGGVLRGDDGVYHLWVSEFSHGCGLTSWLNSSLITHATADTPTGPVRWHDTAVRDATSIHW